MPYDEFTTGSYMDSHGRIWFCVRHDKEGRMVCEGDNGHYTVASFKTFKVWGWAKSNSPIAAHS